MKENVVKYEDIIAGQKNVPEILHKKNLDQNLCIIQDLAILLSIREIYGEMDNFIEAKKNKADLLKKQLNYSYNEHGERNDIAYVQERSKMSWKIRHGKKKSL